MIIPSNSCLNHYSFPILYPKLFLKSQISILNKTIKLDGIGPSLVEPNPGMSLKLAAETSHFLNNPLVIWAISPVKLLVYENRYVDLSAIRKHFATA